MNIFAHTDFIMVIGWILVFFILALISIIGSGGNYGTNPPPKGPRPSVPPNPPPKKP